MSENDSQSNRSGSSNWEHLKYRPKKIKGPEKPWSPEEDASAEEIISGFLKDGEQKKAFQQFVIDTFKQYESDTIARIQARLEHEKEIKESSRLNQFHDPGNITSLVGDTLNMNQVERSFARGLEATQKGLLRSVEDRVEEINRLLAGIGGFSSQLKACFARSTVVFLEQEDPKYSFRERLIFSINLPNYELKRPWGKQIEAGEDKRTPMQATWDDAINALAKTVESTGLKPKYCKNDRHYGRFVMKQDLRSSSHLPDEYFSFTLDYNTDEKIKEMYSPYDKIVADFNKKIGKLEKKLNRSAGKRYSEKYAKLEEKYLELVQDRDFFIGTTPDPHQLDEGLLFIIEVSTLKDYHIVKDRMQTIMTKYILHLSEIAEKEAANDSELGYHLAQSREQASYKSPYVKAAEQQKAEQQQAKRSQKRTGGAGITMQDIDSLPEYVADGENLTPLPKKKKAG